MTDKAINTIIAGAIAAASVASFSLATALTTEWEDFTGYTPPSRFYISWFDYMTSSGNPSAIQYNYDSSGHVRMYNTVAEYPAKYKDYPYRAVLIGGKSTTNSYSAQGHDLQFVLIYSKYPEIDIFDFSYNENKTGYGYLRAQLYSQLSARSHTVGTDKDIEMVSFTSQGMPSGTYSFSVRGMAQFNNSFDFDLWYQCCEGNLEIKGLRGISDCPYAYIRTCLNENGSGGGSTGGSSSGGSGGDSSSSSSGGGGSYSSVNPKPYDPYDPWEGSKPWESPGSYPWESSNPAVSDWEISRPPYQPGEGDTGDYPQDWSPPEWTIPDVPFTDKDITIPGLPINPEYKMPVFPDVDMREGYPDPVLPGGWPPPMPPPTQSSLKKGGAEHAAASDRVCTL